jgi:predicted acetyltransferase
MVEQIELVRLSADLEDAYLSLLVEDPHAAGATRFERQGRDFAAFVRALDAEERGVGLAPRLVPQSAFWLVRRDPPGRTILGASRLRHALNESLEDVGGHIGYDVRASERRKGYGTRLLALTLPHARGLGLARVLLTCDAANVASARVIENNGGVLASQSVSPQTGVLVSRFWIELLATSSRAVAAAQVGQ